MKKTKINCYRRISGRVDSFIPVSGIVMMQDFLTYSILAFLVFRVFDIWKPLSHRLFR